MGWDGVGSGSWVDIEMFEAPRLGFLDDGAANGRVLEMELDRLWRSLQIVNSSSLRKGDGATLEPSPLSLHSLVHLDHSPSSFVHFVHLGPTPSNCAPARLC